MLIIRQINKPYSKYKYLLCVKLKYLPFEYFLHKTLVSPFRMSHNYLDEYELIQFFNKLPNIAIINFNLLIAGIHF